ncbi:MAG: sulfite exporter TauE/SafE family protein [Pseudonocardiales bacterium]|nr:MAG: sulfite exporter TauE/SafE family protein [Pseudonocardiales bacterium]
MNIGLAIVSFFIGMIVGLTGMGGGALMTPVLVLFFGVPPLAAVSSDLVAAAVMKPFGSLVHFRNGTVHLGLVKWLCLGSVPSAFCGVLVTRSLGNGERLQAAVKTSLGVVLVIASFALIVKAYLALVQRARRRAASEDLPPADNPPETLRVRPLPTVVIGAVGGLIVGMTSVGSGSLIIISLIMLYPRLQASQLVGTDLVQAVPLVMSAALGHLLFGDFQLAVTTSLLIGSIPGVLLGATLSARAPGGLIRRALTLVLLASGLKLLGASNLTLGAVLLAVVLLGPPLWMLARRRQGFPPTARQEAKAARERASTAI